MSSVRRATILDVARSAGVSPATVSRTLNRPEAVRSALRSRVLAEVERLGYVPNQAARGLVSKRFSTVGAVFPSLDSALFGGSMQALQWALDDAGYTLLVAASGYDPRRERECVRNLLSRGVDALVLVGAGRDPEVYALIEREGVEHVLLWVTAVEDGRHCVGFDNRAAARAIAEHLLDLGHRELAVVAGDAAVNDRQKARIAGVREALAARGIELRAERVFERPFGVDAGREVVRAIAAGRDRPSAIVCCAEPFAYGVLFESAGQGIPIPSALSVTGFDDYVLSAHVHPALTTVRTPQREMGELAARRLVAILAGEALEPAAPLDFELVVRDSTGPAPAR